MTVAAQPTHPRRAPHRLFGFTTPRRFLLFVVFSFSVLVFSFLRLPYINIDNVFCGTPNRAIAGECYWYRHGIDRAAMFLHLVAFLPAAILACLQFIPAIRRKYALLHRLNGYVIVALSIPGTLGAVLIGRHAMGGSPSAQLVIYMISVMFLAALAKAQVGIKSGRIDQHRAWMLRAWFYAGSIITLRPIMGLTTVITNKTGPHFKAFPCSVVDFILSCGPEELLELFPSCTAYISGDNLEVWTAVQASLDTPVGSVAALRYGFEMATISAFAIHAIGIEIYLHLTNAENERLKEVSRKKIAAGAGTKAQFGTSEAKNSKAE